MKKRCIYEAGPPRQDCPTCDGEIERAVIDANTPSVRKGLADLRDKGVFPAVCKAHEKYAEDHGFKLA